MSEQEATPVTRFARLWAVAFLKILALIVVAVVALGLAMQVLGLPLKVGMWIEMGCGPLECWDEPIDLSAMWYYAQVGWIGVLIAAGMAALKARSEMND